MCSAFTPDCRYDNSILNQLKTCIVQIQFAGTRRLFNLSAEGIIIVLNASACVRYAMFVLRNRRIRFCWWVSERFLFLKRYKNQINTLLKLSISLEGFIRDKGVFTSIHGGKKMKVVTRIFDAKRAAIIWIFFVKTKNRQVCCLMAYFVLSKKQVSPD